MCVDKLCVCVSKLCVSKLCVSKLCVEEAGREEEEAKEEAEARGSAQPKTRTPHKDYDAMIHVVHIIRCILFTPDHGSSPEAARSS